MNYAVGRLAAYRAALMLMRLAIAVVNSVNCAAQSRRMQLPAGRASFPLTQLIPLVASPRRLARPAPHPGSRIAGISGRSRSRTKQRGFGTQWDCSYFRSESWEEGRGDVLFIALVPVDGKEGGGSSSNSLLTLSEFSGIPPAHPRRISRCPLRSGQECTPGDMQAPNLHRWAKVPPSARKRDRCLALHVIRSNRAAEFDVSYERGMSPIH